MTSRGRPTLESKIVPKVIVLFPGAHHDATAPMAEAVAAAAARVRFTEVELRATSAGTTGGRQHVKVLGPDEHLSDYDAVVVVTSSPADADRALETVLGAAERGQPSNAFLNTVFAVAGTDDSGLLARLARLGGILVTVPRGSDDPAGRARALGERVATVAEWVRHARSHEHAHSHEHSHHHHHS
jgi:hypothetical protein